VNTTELIVHWTMEGATAQDVRATGDLDAVVGDHRESPTATREPFRLRRSDEEEWTPLLPARGEN